MKLSDIKIQSPIRLAESKKSVKIVHGHSGTVITGGIISQTDYNADLTGTQGIRKYNKMRLSDATVKAALLAIKLPILSARWYFETASEDPKDQFVRDFVEDNFENRMTRTWSDTLRESLLFLDWGRMIFETIYQDVTFENQKYLGIKKFDARLPETIWAWQTEGGGKGITQHTTAKGKVSIPIEKLVILVNEKEGDNWEGISVLRAAYRHWYTKDVLYQIDAIAHERQGLGIPYGIEPSESTDEQDADRLEDILIELRAMESGFVMIPSGWEVGFMDMKGKTTRDPEKSILHHDRQITKSVLAQFLELGAKGGGSYALDESQQDLFFLAEQATAKNVRDTFQQYAVNRLVDLNFDVTDYPKLNFEKMGTIDFDKLTTALQRLYQSKLLTSDVATEQYLRKIMELPELSDEIMAERIEIEKKRMEIMKENPMPFANAGDDKDKPKEKTDEEKDNAMKAVDNLQDEIRKLLQDV